MPFHGLEFLIPTPLAAAIEVPNRVSPKIYHLVASLKLNSLQATLFLNVVFRDNY